MIKLVPIFMLVLCSCSINNVVFVTGDTHTSLALDVVTDPFNGYDISGKGSIAVELGTTSINSGNADE